jgi:hypothetical protein
VLEVDTSGSAVAVSENCAMLLPPSVCLDAEDFFYTLS